MANLVEIPDGVNIAEVKRQIEDIQFTLGDVLEEIDMLIKVADSLAVKLQKIELKVKKDN